jgi:hypothetical protein
LSDVANPCHARFSADSCRVEILLCLPFLSLPPSSHLPACTQNDPKHRTDLLPDLARPESSLRSYIALDAECRPGTFPPLSSMGHGRQGIISSLAKSFVESHRDIFSLDPEPASEQPQATPASSFRGRPVEVTSGRNETISMDDKELARTYQVSDLGIEEERN